MFRLVLSSVYYKLIRNRYSSFLIFLFCLRHVCDSAFILFVLSHTLYVIFIFFNNTLASISFPVRLHFNYEVLFSSRVLNRGRPLIMDHQFGSHLDYRRSSTLRERVRATTPNNSSRYLVIRSAYLRFITVIFEIREHARGRRGKNVRIETGASVVCTARLEMNISFL